MEILIETAKQVPALVVMTCLVRFFLGAMSEARRDYLTQLATMSDAHLQAREEQRKASEIASAVAREYAVAMQRLADAVGTCVKSTI